MASKYTPTAVTQGFNSEVSINKNFTDIKAAIDDMLNRAEVLTSNAMLIPLDMGGFTVTNLPAATQATEAVRFGQLNALSVQDVVSTLTFSATLSIDVDTVSLGILTLTGNTTVTFTGTPTDGQPILLRLIQDASGSRIVTWESRVRFSTDLGATALSTTGLKTDYILLRYNTAANKWDVLALNRGF